MKTKIFLLFFLVFSRLLHADATQDQINTLIQAIVESNPDTRYEKVNAFKLKMRELNLKQRQKALESLQQKMYPALNADKTAQGYQQRRHSDKAHSGALQQQIRMQQRMQMHNGQGSQKGGGTPKTPQPRPGKQ